MKSRMTLTDVCLAVNSVIYHDLFNLLQPDNDSMDFQESFKRSQNAKSLLKRFNRLTSLPYFFMPLKRQTQSLLLGQVNLEVMKESLNSMLELNIILKNPFGSDANKLVGESFYLRGLVQYQQLKEKPKADYSAVMYDFFNAVLLNYPLAEHDTRNVLRHLNEEQIVKSLQTILNDIQNLSAPKQINIFKNLLNHHSIFKDKFIEFKAHLTINIEEYYQTLLKSNTHPTSSIMVPTPIKKALSDFGNFFKNNKPIKDEKEELEMNSVAHSFDGKKAF